MAPLIRRDSGGPFQVAQAHKHAPGAEVQVLSTLFSLTRALIAAYTFILVSQSPCLNTVRERRPPSPVKGRRACPPRGAIQRT